MKTTKYILHNFFGYFIIYSSIIFLLFLLNELYRFIQALLLHKTPILTVLKIFVSLFPAIISIAVPITFLLSTILTFAVMCEQNEITILNTMGINQWQYTKTVIFLSFITSIIMLYFNGYIVPQSNQYFKKLYITAILSSPATKFSSSKFVFIENKKIFAQKVYNKNSLENVYIFNPENEPLYQTIFAKNATVETDIRENILFNLYDGWVNILDKSQPQNNTMLKFNKYVFTIYSKQKTSFISETKTFREMTNKELFKEILFLRQEKTKNLFFYQQLLTEYFLRYTLSFSIFVFTLLGIVLAHRFKQPHLKHNAKPLSFVITIIVVGIYYFLLTASITLCKNTKITNFTEYYIATIMQAPNIIFFIIYFILAKIYKE